MPASKIIITIFLGKESAINILSTILSSNSSYIDELQNIAEDIANQTEVTDDE